ncbi:hypothetical protein [Actinomadura bangladeshensis]|uniref:Uncharacterized protein n=2 Tax=Actinomadura bangladeshensis TaxID=453573 RepID=A0A4R4NZL7_9ACTN|nr:hypothetical protein E1284_16400 [Actinomadura bangladeshensis]
METGMLIRWGAPRQGREEESLDLFRQCDEYYRGLVADGKLTFYEPFLLGSGDSEVESGFFIIKGEVAGIFGLLDDQKFRNLMTQGSILTEHYRFDMLAVGESVDRGLDEYRQALTAVGV